MTTGPFLEFILGLLAHCSFDLEELHAEKFLLVFDVNRSGASICLILTEAAAGDSPTFEDCAALKLLIGFGCNKTWAHGVAHLF